MSSHANEGLKIELVDRIGIQVDLFRFGRLGVRGSLFAWLRCEREERRRHDDCGRRTLVMASDALTMMVDVTTIPDQSQLMMVLGRATFACRW